MLRIRRRKKEKEKEKEKNRELTTAECLSFMKVHLIAVVAGSVAVGRVRLAVLRFSRGMTCITFSSSSFPSFSLAFSLFLSAYVLW